MGLQEPENADFEAIARFTDIKIHAVAAMLGITGTFGIAEKKTCNARIPIGIAKKKPLE